MLLSLNICYLDKIQYQILAILEIRYFRVFWAHLMMPDLTQLKS